MQDAPGEPVEGILRQDAVAISSAAGCRYDEGACIDATLAQGHRESAAGKRQLADSADSGAHAIDASEMLGWVHREVMWAIEAQ